MFKNLERFKKVILRALIYYIFIAHFIALFTSSERSNSFMQDTEEDLVQIEDTEAPISLLRENAP